MNILGPTTITVETAQAWARSRGASDLYVSLAPLYWRFAPERGVVAEVAYAQCAKETGFCKFGGVIDASFCNPCGLKTKAGGANSDPAAHQTFPNWDVGVSAHLDHLALYAGALGYPRPGSPDPRHFDYLLGDAPTVEALGGTWAPSDTYGTSLVSNFVAPMLSAPSVAAPEFVTRAVALGLAANVCGELRTALEAELLAARDDLRTQIADLDTRVEALPLEADVVAGALEAVEERLHNAIAGLFS